MPAHYYAYRTFLDSMQALHNDFVNDKENASMAHHLARRTKREKEHPMCGAAPLSPQFGAKVQKKLFSNKFFRQKIDGGLPTTPLQRLTRSSAALTPAGLYTSEGLYPCVAPYPRFSAFHAAPLLPSALQPTGIPYFSPSLYSLPAPTR